MKIEIHIIIYIRIHKQTENENNLKDLLKNVDAKTEEINIDFSNQVIYHEYNETTIEEFRFL